MASAEAMAALRRGRDDWAGWCEHQSGRIDLRLAQFDRVDLTGYRFVRCDFAGSDAEGASFDGTEIIDCTFESLSLVRASFVGASVVDSAFVEVDLGRATFRDSRLVRCRLERVELARLTFEATDLDHTSIVSTGKDSRLNMVRCRLTDSVIDTLAGSLSVSDCVLVGVRCSGFTLTEWQMDSTEIRGGEFREVSSTTHVWRMVLLEKVKLTRVDPGDGASDGVAAIDCRVFQCHLGHLGLSAMTLAGSALLDCEWPDQTPEISLTGRVTSATNLMRQPVQDVLGVDPLRRRAIADAQYIEALHQQAAGRWTRVALLRVWGMTSSFGQSMARLIASAALAIAVLTVLQFLAANMESIGWHPTGQLLPMGRIISEVGESAAEVSGSFFGFTQADAPDSWVLASIYWLSRLLGFATLGVLIGVASTRIGKLSSE